MSSDSDSVADLSFILLELSTNLIVILGSIALLFYYLGATALVSLLLFLLLIPITNKVALQFTEFDDQIMQSRDKRLNLMGQILNAIRLIKYFVWEKSVEQEVLKIRDEEVKTRTKIVRADSFAFVIYIC
jgi:ABC-type multidrug transport system fused ATPase/permease subunit